MSEKKEDKATKDTKEKRPSIYLVTINNSGIRNEYSANAMFSLAMTLGLHGITGVSTTYDDHPISNARNVAVKEFLSKPEFSHLFFLDSDCVPDPDAILRLLSYDEPIVSGWYISRRGNLPVVLKITEKNYPKSMKDIMNDPSKFPRWQAYRASELFTLLKDKKGLVTVDGIGCGCMLIKREVFDESMKELPHPEQPYFLEDHYHSKSFGEDLYFGLNCKIHGIPIKLDLNVFCGHWSWGVIGTQALQRIIQMERQQTQGTKAPS